MIRIDSLVEIFITFFITTKNQKRCSFLEADEYPTRQFHPNRVKSHRLDGDRVNQGFGPPRPRKTGKNARALGVTVEEGLEIMLKPPRIIRSLYLFNSFEQ